MSFASHGDGQRPVKPSVGDNLEAKEFRSALKIHLDARALLIDAELYVRTGRVYEFRCFACLYGAQSVARRGGPVVDRHHARGLAIPPSLSSACVSACLLACLLAERANPLSSAKPSPPSLALARSAQPWLIDLIFIDLISSIPVRLSSGSSFYTTNQTRRLSGEDTLVHGCRSERYRASVGEEESGTIKNRGDTGRPKTKMAESPAGRRYDNHILGKF